MTNKFEHQHQLKPEGIKGNLDNPAVPKLLRWLPTAFLLSVIGLGAVGTLLTPEARRWPAGPLLTGEAQAEYEKQNLDAHVPWRGPSVDLWGGLNYRLFGEARDGALIGKNGWLFSSEEFQTGKNDAQEIRNKLAYIGQVRDELAQGGSKLVVALIPAKARIYADQTGAKVPAQWQPVYQEFRRGLEKAGIAAPDLEAALSAARKPSHEVFLHTDTHWTPFGAVIAAQTLAPVIRAMQPDLPPASYSTGAKPAAQLRGDLLRFIPVPAGQGPKPDTVQEPEYTRSDSGGGLLGDEPLAVTLVGTSYSAPSKENVWHFAGALGRALNTEVLNAAQEGRGPILPMRDYLSSKERRDNPPKVVVWEIPERFLRVEYPNTDKNSGPSVME